MKKYIVYMILTSLMLASFFISGLFFVNSGMIDFQDGEFDEENGIRFLADLDTLPLIKIDAYEIDFHSHGEIIAISNESISFFSYHEDEETFDYDGDSSGFSEGERIVVYYNYLPEGGKKVVRIRRADERSLITVED